MDAKANIPLNMSRIIANLFKASESRKNAEILAIIAMIGNMIGK
jgi:hypothetical protein